MTALCSLYRSSLGKKVVMALTGLVMIGFVAAHMVGNLKIFMGAGGPEPMLDIYARSLREMGEHLFGHAGLLWIARSVLIVSVILHIVSAVQLKRMSLAARPVGYKKTHYRASTLAARTMYWGGAFLALYIVYHILHFTTGTMHFSGFVEGHVYDNVVSAFRNPLVVGIYVLAMVFLGMHLYHGVWSLFQTLGIDTPDRNRALRTAARVLAVVIPLGFAIVPLAVFAGLVPARTTVQASAAPH